jgi:surface antigen
MPRAFGVARGAVLFGVLAAIGLGAGASHAQSYSFFYGLSSVPLTTEDIKIIERAAAPLFAAAPVGGVAQWQNPDSGNSGSMTLRKVYELKGMQCREVSYTMKYSDRRLPSVSKADWCQQPSGEWKLVDPNELKHH